MLESSRNALLKILEEPPESVRFVLASSRRIAIMTTILSRARTYHFSPRDPACTALVIERVFRSSESASSVEAFLAARRPFPPARARELAESFLGAALAARAGAQASRADALSPPLAALARASASEIGEHGSSVLADLLESSKDFGQKDDSLSSSFRAFLSALSSRLAALLREEGMDAEGIRLIETIAASVRSASNDYETLNRSPGLLAEALMYAIGDTVFPTSAPAAAAGRR
jgi:DNA polymerase-3 subunit gamma/tau